MAAYIPALRGYIADVPEFWFKRLDGNMFHFDEITQASVTPNVNFTEVNAGWSLYPVAYLPAAATMEIQLTSGQFDSRLFNLANGGEFEADAAFKRPVHETVTVTGGTATLSSDLQVTDVSVAGFAAQKTTVETPAAVSGKVVWKSASGSDGYVTTLYFYNGEYVNNGQMEVDYYETVTTGAETLKITNEQAAVGEAVLRWPVYNAGENFTQGQNFTGASICGYMYMRVYRCRVTSMPGFDTSYKSAATNSITLSTMDPKNANSDGNAYELTYMPVANA